VSHDATEATISENAVMGKEAPLAVALILATPK